MEVQWCWRCQSEVPMFNDEEYAQIHREFMECTRHTKQFRQNTGASLAECNFQELFQPLIELHEAMTGIRELNHNAIIHHHRAKYGPPCAQCGKVLRTPRSRKCYECGEQRP